jgi:hypothetical protein
MSGSRRLAKRASGRPRLSAGSTATTYAVAGARLRAAFFASGTAVTPSRPLKISAQTLRNAMSIKWMRFHDSRTVNASFRKQASGRGDSCVSFTILTSIQHSADVAGKQLAQGRALSARNSASNELDGSHCRLEPSAIVRILVVDGSGPRSSD